MAFLIQGVFFQERSSLGIQHESIRGSVVVVRRGVCQFMYAGALWQDPDDRPGIYIGRMQDYFGDSFLTNLVVSDHEVSFTKTYENERRERPPIVYTFLVRDGNTWVGEYASPSVGAGVTRCIITEVNDEFFLPEDAMRLLGREKAHIWTGW